MARTQKSVTRKTAHTQESTFVKFNARRSSTYAAKVAAAEAAEYGDSDGEASTPKKFHIQPKNENQADLLEAIQKFDITVAIGPAGTGKTYCGCMKIAQLYNTGKYERIVLCRANVPTGKSLGSFPGTVQEKMAPWLAPMISVLKKAFGKYRYEMLEKRGEIEIQPLETIRGQSFENSLILIDESQNLNMEEIKAITTRMGEGSKMVMMGDPNQSDIDNGLALTRFTKLCKSFGIEIPVIQFTVDDIVRSDIVGALVRMFTQVDVSDKPKAKTNSLQFNTPIDTTELLKEQFKQGVVQ